MSRGFQRRSSFAAIGAVLLLAAGCSSQAAARPGRWSLRHVAVVDVRSGQVLRDQTVVIRGERIVSIAPTRESDLERGTTAIEAAGRFLIPGLWDMHAHLWDHDVTPALFLANGVTGIRDMGSDTSASVALREAVRRGERKGPRIVTSGAVLDGPREEPAPHRFTIASVEEAGPAIVRVNAAGVDFVKVYHFLTRDVYLVIASEARKQGLAVAGHLPPGVTIGDAIAAGQTSIEHLYGIREQILRGDEAAVGEAARQSAAAGVWHTPTLAHYRSVAFRDAANSPYVPDPYSRFLTPQMRELWDKFMPARQRTPEQERELASSFVRLQGAVRQLHGAGVRLLAGSDNGIKYVYPGFGLHDELAQLAAAGLSPLEALRTATTNAAQHLKLESDLGAIEAGKLADLVLLSGDPTGDIRHTRDIVAVVANGVYLDRAALDSMLEAASRR